MNRVFLLFLAIFSIQITAAQYTEIINSKRPGFSESPYSIGTNVYQFETGFFYRNSDNPLYSSPSNTYGGELLFRYGKFSEKLEFDLNLAYQVDDLSHHPNGHIKGISDLTIGAKYLIRQQEYADRSKEIRSFKKRYAFDWKRLIPSIGIYAGVHTKFVSKDFKEDDISYKLALLLQNDFTDRLVVLTNLMTDKYTTDDVFYKYIVTMTYAIDQDWSFFIENQGQYQEKFTPKYQFGTGLAYLINENLQIDASARTNFFDNYTYYYISTGLAWRLDRHYDTFTIKNSPKKTIGKKKKRKGFFGRLFGKKRN